MSWNSFTTLIGHILEHSKVDFFFFEEFEEQCPKLLQESSATLKICTKRQHIFNFSCTRFLLPSVCLSSLTRTFIPLRPLSRFCTPLIEMCRTHNMANLSQQPQWEIMPKADAAAGRTPPLSSWLLTAAAGRGGNSKSSAQVGGWKRSILAYQNRKRKLD